MSSERSRPRRRMHGLTLVELIIFMVVVSVGLAGVLAVFNLISRNSSDPVIDKQAIAIAEAIMEEVRLQPFTFCDPGDAAVLTATSPAACTVSMDNPANWGAGNCRAGGVVCDHVAKYNGFQMNDGNGGIRDALGNSNSRLTGFSSQVTVAFANAGFNQPGAVVAANDALRISVLVQRGTTAVQLSGFRLRHSPNSPG